MLQAILCKCMKMPGCKVSKKRLRSMGGLRGLPSGMHHGPDWSRSNFRQYAGGMPGQAAILSRLLRPLRRAKPQETFTAPSRSRRCFGAAREQAGERLLTGSTSSLP